MDKVALKERERNTWTYAAEGWRRQDEMLRKGAAPATDRMLVLAGLASGERVLDIASGTGEPAISAAHIVGSGGQVIGIDLVDEMLSVAREKAEAAQLKNIEFIHMDGEALANLPGKFDVVTMRWGLMFMPDPGACLRRAHSAMQTGGRLVLACWAAPEKNPFVSLLMKILAKYTEIPKPPVGTPGIFAMADPDRLRDVVITAGFTDFRIEALELDVIEVADGAAYWQSISDLAAPVMVLVNELSAEDRECYINEVIEAANALKEGDSLKMKGTTWIASAKK
ncbi:MAG: class I SAM-dependent methyltransferase [Thiohalomonadales bacterium]